MSLLNRLRPKWQNSDADVRAEAVRALDKNEVELLTAVAQQDPDPRVRRVAIRKLDAPRTLLELAESDADPGVRRSAEKRARQLLVQIATDSRDEPESLRALELLTEAEDIVTVATKAHFEPVRTQAFSALETDSARAELALKSKDSAVRHAALDGIEDSDVLKSIVMSNDAAELAVTALGKIDSIATLEWIVDQHGTPKAIKRHATAKLLTLVDDDHPLKAAKHDASIAALVERAESLGGEDTPARRAELSEIASEWSKLTAATAAPKELAARFEAVRTAMAANTAEERTRDDAAATEADVPDAPAPDDASSEATTAAVEPSASDREADALAVGLDEAETEALATTLADAKQKWDTLDDVSEGSARRYRDAVESANARLAAMSSRQAGEKQLAELLSSIAAAVAGSDVSEASREFTRLSKTYRHLETFASVEAKARYASAEQRLQELKEKVRLDREAEEQKTLSAVQATISRMKELSSASELSLKDADKELRKAQDLIKNMGPLSRSVNRKKIRRDLSQAREELYKKAQQLRDVEAWKRWANADIQEGLITRVEALKESKDVPKIAKELRTIQAEWKQAGSAPADKSEDLWKRYRTVRDELKQRCDAFFKKQDAERRDNLTKKQALCDQVEALKDESDWNQTADKIKALQAEWKKIGAVPKKHSDAIWKRFRASCDHFFARRKEHFGELKDERDGNLKKKQALCEQAEAIQNSTDWRSSAAELKKLQAEWKKVGPIPRKHSDQLWARFRAACDRFFDRFKRKDEVEAEESIGKRRELVERAKALADGGPEQDELAERVTALWSEWKALGVLPETAAELQAQLEAHLSTLVSGAPEAFANSELDPKESLKKRERLVKRMETLVKDFKPESVKSEGAALEDLAARLKDALASNTMTGGKGKDDGREWRRASEEVRKLSANWRRAAPVPGDEGRQLGQRFQAAYRDFFAHKPEASRT